MAQTLQVIIRLSREKRVVDDAGSVNTAARMQGITEGFVYNSYNSVGHVMPEMGTPHCSVPLIMNTFPKTCPSSAFIPFGRVYTYPYIPLSVVPSPPVAQVKVNSGMLFT